MDAVEDVKARLNIEDIIGEYVQLKRAGRNFRGLSPFSNEKTPSFMVSPEKQIWHDFSSGKGGNMFSFVMEMEGLDFKGALEHLARKAGVDLSQYRSGRQADTGKTKERLYEAMEAATKFYQVQFTKSQQALEYVFKKRQFTKQVALDFRLGYSPNNGSALADYLIKIGFTDKELSQAGLTARRYQSQTDMFRGRLMIPLQDGQGKVIGFTARLLEDVPNAPKYINTPQTLLYDKSRHVYGLHLAKSAIRSSGFAVLVEGNLDVIASHQVGVSQVVATAGTALTEQHLKAIHRFSGDLRLAFDQDKAGLAATERAIPIASKVGVSLSIITVPSGKDPDELIKQDPALWSQAIEQHDYALDWLIERYKSQLDLSSAIGKRQFSDVILSVVGALPDSVEQDHFVAKIADIIGVSKEALLTKLKLQDNAPSRPKRQAKTKPNELDKSELNYRKDQDHFVALMLMQPALRHYLKGMTPDMLPQSSAQTILKFLIDKSDFNGEPSELQELLKTSNNSGQDMQNMSDYVRIIQLQFEELYKGIELLELRNEAARLQTRLIEQYVKVKKQTIIDALPDADEAEQQQLLESAKQLDELLKTT